MHASLSARRVMQGIALSTVDVRSNVGRMIIVFGSPNQRTCDPANDYILGVVVGELQAPAMQHRTEVDHLIESDAF